MKRFQYLDYTHDFWSQFVKGDDIDTEGLKAAGITEGQFEGIKEKLVENGYIKAPIVKALEATPVAELKTLAEEKDVQLPEGAHKPEIVSILAEAGVEPEEKKKRSK